VPVGSPRGGACQSAGSAGSDRRLRARCASSRGARASARLDQTTRPWARHDINRRGSGESGVEPTHATARPSLAALQRRPAPSARWWSRGCARVPSQERSICRRRSTAPAVPSAASTTWPNASRRSNRCSPRATARNRGLARTSTQATRRKSGLPGGPGALRTERNLIYGEDAGNKTQPCCAITSSSLRIS
jgi:hypothetical protein